MKRNLYRRIETACPIWDKSIKQTIIDTLNIQLLDNTKACFINDQLNNVFKRNETQHSVWAQQDIYRLLQTEMNGDMTG
jgi:polyphosphate kinase